MSTVFFRTKDGPVRADQFVNQQAPIFQDQLEAAAQELAHQGELTTGRVSGPFEGGLWSLWLEDSQGERVNFQLYVSRLEDPPQTTANRFSGRRLYIEVQVNPREREFLPAKDYIDQNFQGDTKAQLLLKLSQALSGHAASDETISFSGRFVTIRLRSKNSQLRIFDAELTFEWREDDHRS